MTHHRVVAELERLSRRDQTMEPAVQKSKVIPGTRFSITQPTYLHQQPQMEGSGFKVKAPAGYEVEATGKIHQNMVEVTLAVASSKVPSQIRNKTWWVDVDSLGRSKQSAVGPAPCTCGRVPSVSWTLDDNFRGTRMYVVHCMNKACQNNRYVKFKSKAEAIRAWNDALGMSDTNTPLTANGDAALGRAIREEIGRSGEITPAVGQAILRIVTEHLVNRTGSVRTAATKAEFERLVAVVGKNAIDALRDKDLLDDFLDGDDSKEVMRTAYGRAYAAYKKSGFYKTVVGNLLAIGCADAEHQDTVAAAYRGRNRTMIEMTRSLGYGVFNLAVGEYITENADDEYEDDDE